MNNETAVKLKLTQTTASYRRPGSFVVRESYPLPPYSTVIGFVHAACGFTEYVPMRVSVRGVSAAASLAFPARCRGCCIATTPYPRAA